MIQTKNLEDLLDRKSAQELFFKYRKECGLSNDFEIQNIHRHLVLSPNTYAILYEIFDEDKIKKIRVNASQEETRKKAYKVMTFLQDKFPPPIFYIPKIYFYDEDYNLNAYENVEGKILIQQLKEGNLETKIKMAGLWLKKLHSIDSDNLELLEHKIFFNFSALEKFYLDLAKKGPTIIKELEESLDDYPSKLIHGDYQPNNIIVDNNRIIVFDFNDSQIADPALDLAKFLTQLKVMLFRFSDISLFENLKKIFLNNYRLEYNQTNFKIYSKMYYLQILCSLSASLAEEPEAKRTLPEVHKYFEEINV